MKFQARWWLPMLMAGSLVVACSDNGGGGGGTTADSGVDASVPTDMGGTDATVDRPDVATDRVTPPVDRPPPPNPCATPTDISSMMPGADGAIHIMGDNSMGAPVQVGTLPMGCPLGTSGGDPGFKGNVVVYRYTMRGTGLLRVSTNNPGTEDGFDTVVAVLGTCSATAASIACNDDVGGGNLTSTATTAMPVMMGQTVFIVVGGWGTDPAKAAQGAFELTVAETAPIAIGGACMAGSVCATGSSCVPNVGSTTMGTCVADGAARAACRVMAPNCDMGLACTVATPAAGARGVCLTAAAVGESCGATAVCTMGSVCPNFIAPGATMPPPPVDAGTDAGATDASASDASATDASATDASTADVAPPSDGGTPAATRRCVATVAETEPNNTQMAAQAAVTTSTVFRAALPSGDTDCFGVTVPAGATLFAETSDAVGACGLGMGADTVLNVYSAGGAMAIANNDDAMGRGLCSTLDGASTMSLRGLAAGTYQVCVSAFAPMGGDPVAIANYFLTVGIR